jgi:hypothetical protein
MLRRFLLFIFPIVFVGCSSSIPYSTSTEEVAPIESAALFTGPISPKAPHSLALRKAEDPTVRMVSSGVPGEPIINTDPELPPEPVRVDASQDLNPPGIDAQIAAQEAEKIAEPSRDLNPVFNVTASQTPTKVPATAQITDVDLLSSVQIKQQTVKRLTKYNVFLAETRIKNILAEPLEIQTLVQFKNNEGETVSNSRWKYTVLLPDEEITLTDTTLDPQVARFILYIRRPHSLRMDGRDFSSRLTLASTQRLSIKPL